MLITCFFAYMCFTCMPDPGIYTTNVVQTLLLGCMPFKVKPSTIRNFSTREHFCAADAECVIKPEPSGSMLFHLTYTEWCASMSHHWKPCNRMCPSSWPLPSSSDWSAWKWRQVPYTWGLGPPLCSWQAWTSYSKLCQYMLMHLAKVLTLTVILYRSIPGYTLTWRKYQAL